MRKPLIAGNWKMNLNHLEAIAHVQKIAFTVPKKYYDLVDISILAPFTDLRSIQTLIQGDKLTLSYGAQDLSIHEKGAYTGEISGAFLSKLGCTEVVVGHSERRMYHHETNEIVSKKILAALRNNLTPILCVGEDLELRQGNLHEKFCEDQLTESLQGLNAEQISKIVIAYEPIWAIGTGVTATSNDAEQICKLIRNKIKDITNQEISNNTRILYGGSVNLANIEELITQPNIDGALIGGASLISDDFAKICVIAAQKGN